MGTNQESPEGLDVCLKCFLAVCPDSIRNHTQLHYMNTGHRIFLNIKKRAKKPRQNKLDDEQSPPKMMKLAIEAERDEDRFDTELMLRDVVDGGLLCITVDLLSEQWKPIITGILNATSYSKKEEIQAWEQEIVPCKHIQEGFTQQTFTRKSDGEEQAGLFKNCLSCELTENLWLCLECGNVGCGRAQFGGVGGNGHGLAHYEATGHKFSVKLGSITPEGSADVFCYVCSDEIRDPDLVSHLAHFGLHIAHLTKTEKSLTELQIEQNLKWEFSMTSDDGSALKPVAGQGLTGMKNLGNSCYLSSVVQCLFSLDAFVNRFTNPSESILVEEKNPAHNLEVQMHKLADGLLSGRYAIPDTTADTPYQRGIATGMFKSLIGNGHPEFSSMRQQDAFEFLQYLNDKIRTLCKSTGMPDPTQCFEFESYRRFECDNCHKVRYKVENEESVGLDVPARKAKSQDDSAPDEDVYEPVTIDECLDSMVASESLENYRCPGCKQQGSATVSVKFKSFPEVLVVNARRFQIVDWVPRKLNIPVIVPSNGEISLDKYLSKGPQADEDVLNEEDIEEEDASEQENGEPFIADETMMVQLNSMGFPNVRCEKALYNVQNRSAEEAMEWLLAHMDDADIDKPLDLGSKGSQKTMCDPEAIQQLVDMGFAEARAKYALTSEQSVPAAIEWLFANADAPIPSDIVGLETADQVDSGNKKPRGRDSIPANYELKAIICHKGSSIHVGHYVAFIKKDGEWVLFNDEKVVLGGDAVEMGKYAYIYMFVRK